MKPETQCVHQGTLADEISGGVNSPLCASSAFAYRNRSEVLYPRYGNLPNQRAVIHKLCALEGAEDGVLFSSGQGAISAALLAHLQAGDELVAQTDLYGGTLQLLQQEIVRRGVQIRWVEADGEAIAAAIGEKTRVVYVESPTNPLLRIVDLEAVANQARRMGAITIIDNTFASPINQQPLTLGFDLVVHSGTKYLGGHSDLSSGVVLGKAELIAPIRATSINLGATLNPQDAWLLERSLKTLSLRMREHNRNAQHLAEFLAGCPAVKQVWYPGQPSHPGHATACKQMQGFGGMLAFELDQTRIDPDAFLDRLRIIQPALSLGGVESLICQPTRTSHKSLSLEAQAAMGLNDGVMRLAVGIEHLDDLIKDIQDALTEAD